MEESRTTQRSQPQPQPDMVVRTYCERFRADSLWPVESYCIIHVGNIYFVRQSYLPPDIQQQFTDLLQGITPEHIYMVAEGPKVLGFFATRSYTEGDPQKMALEITAAIGTWLVSPQTMRAITIFARGTGHTAIKCRTKNETLAELLMRRGWVELAPEVFGKDL